MKKFFLLNIILLTFCVCDTDIVAYNSYHFYDSIKVELVDQYTFNTSNVYETSSVKIESKIGEIFKIGFFDYSNYRTILRNQNSTFENISIHLLSFFTTFRHSTNLPDLLS